MMFGSAGGKVWNGGEASTAFSRIFGLLTHSQVGPAGGHRLALVTAVMELLIGVGVLWERTRRAATSLLCLWLFAATAAVMVASQWGRIEIGDCGCGLPRLGLPGGAVADVVVRNLLIIGACWLFPSGRTAPGAPGARTPVVRVDPERRASCGR